MQSRFAVVLLVVVSLPFLSSAQTWNRGDRPPLQPSESPIVNPPKGEPGDTVSVRDLIIPEKARRSFEKGTRMLAAGDAEASIAEFKRAISAFHNYYEAYYQMGTAQVFLGLPQEAEDAFNKSIQLSDGRFAMPYFGLSMVLCHENNFGEGDTLAKTGLSLSPNSLIGQFSLGWAELGLGRLTLAEKTLHEVLQRKPNFPEARLLLLEIHRRQSSLPELVDDIEAYLKLDTTSPTSVQLRALRELALHALMQSGNLPPVPPPPKP